MGFGVRNELNGAADEKPVRRHYFNSTQVGWCHSTASLIS